MPQHTAGGLETRADNKCGCVWASAPFHGEKLRSFLSLPIFGPDFRCQFLAPILGEKLDRSYYC